MSEVYLSRSEFAQRIGVKVGTLSRYKLPEPDVIVGSGKRPTFGWSERTIDQWQASRPSVMAAAMNAEESRHGTRAIKPRIKK